MGKHSRRRRIGLQGRLGLSLGRCFFAGILGIASGCAGAQKQPATGDPLVGGLPAAAPGHAAVQPPAPGNNARPPLSGPAPPPLIPANASTSNAALAGRTSQPLLGTNDLRIGEPAPRSIPRPANLTGGAVLRQPEIPDPSRRPDAVAPVNTTWSASSYEQVQSILVARGVVWQRLETWGDQGEWKFSCSIPNPQNAYISRTYEGRARDYLSAMQAVLEQIQKDR